MSNKNSFECFTASPYFSSKHVNYFNIYDKIFERFKNKEIVFVEFGVFAGGSLFMWREFFGPNARIIGVDLNPDALKWRDYGFEIYIGDQSDSLFLDNLFLTIGQVDIVLDDGGHKYDQQIITSFISINNIKDDGLLVVEDTHTSYQKEFGSGSKFSFINWSKKCVDIIHRRYPDLLLKDSLNSNVFKRVFSITFYESITVFNINSSLSTINEKVINGGFYSDQIDFRYSGTLIGKILKHRRKFLDLSVRSAIIMKLLNIFDFSIQKIGKFILCYWERYKLLKLRSLFKGL